MSTSTADSLSPETFSQPEDAAETVRPQIHYTAKRGWLNDPNGCLYVKGEWHLFYQHNPWGNEWGNMSWGHAVSRDLTHWEELPVALLPDERGTVFSGSAVFDADNTSGLARDGRPAMVAAYTHALELDRSPSRFVQSLAVSHDFGRTWVQYEGNPVVPNLTGCGDRDPKVFWHAPTNRWVMALYLDTLQGADGRPAPGAEPRSFAIFTSPNLRDWTQTQHIPGGQYECPELFELPAPIDSEPNRTLWVLQEASSEYLVGTFDGSEFRAVQDKLRLDYGPNYYAAQNFNDAPASHGPRAVQIAWMRGGSYPGAVFNQQMSAPHELSLRNVDGRYVLCRRFAPALMRNAQPVAPVAAASSDAAVHVECSFRETLRFTAHGVTFTVDAGARTIVREGAPAIGLPQQGTALSVAEILVDTTSVEILLNHGEIGASFCIVPVPNSPAFELLSSCEQGLAPAVHKFRL